MKPRPRGRYRVAGEYIPRMPLALFVATEEFRPPKKGEWYLSGAIVEAYRAPFDFSLPYWIAKQIEG